MKWGVRRNAKNYSPRSLKREYKKLDKQDIHSFTMREVAKRLGNADMYNLHDSNIAKNHAKKKEIENRARKNGYSVQKKYGLKMPMTYIKGQGVGVIPIGSERLKIKKKRSYK